jgi:exonuclease VII small subunit
MTTSADPFIDELDHARQTMRKLLQDLEAMHASSWELYPTWTIKELLSHLAGWDDACIASLQAFLQDDAPGTPAARGIDLYNASTVAERAELPLEKVIQEWEQTREVFKLVIRALPAEKLDQPFVFPWGPTGTLDRLVHIFADHEEEHAEEIRKML